MLVKYVEVVVCCYRDYLSTLRVNTAYVILLFALLGIAVTFAGSRRAVESAGANGAAAAADDAKTEDAEGGESE